MRVTFHDHGGKGARIADALHAAGHETVNGDGDIAVIDHDYYEAICDTHEVVVLYPHGGNVILDWTTRQLHRNVKLNLVHAPGYVEVYEATGLPVPSVPIGWCYSDLAEPRYPAEVRNVLFAPLHPLATGYLGEQWREANRATLAALLDSGLEVSVRIFGPAAGYGLDPESPVRWSPGGSLAHGDIDGADLVVAAETVLHLAVARGVPALSFGADLIPDIGHDAPLHPVGWDDYRALYRYPYDIADDDFDFLVRLVSKPSAAVEQWRARFVGEAFDAGLAVGLIEAALDQHLRAVAH